MGLVKKLSEAVSSLLLAHPGVSLLKLAQGVSPGSHLLKWPLHE